MCEIDDIELVRKECERCMREDSGQIIYVR